jgi:ribosomal-protein-alanine N-acetyltransferase
MLLKWEIRSVNPPENMDILSRIHAIQEAAWTEDQLRSSLAGATTRVHVAIDSSPDGGSIGGVHSAASEIQGFLLARRLAAILGIDLRAVARSKRRLGMGRSLLLALIEEECRWGLHETRLELAASNGVARTLYQRIGFVVVGERKRYYPNGDVALLLSRRNLSAIP